MLSPGANAALPPAGELTLTVRTARAHADLVVLCVRADGTADGDDAVALWTQPVCAGGAVRIDTGQDRVQITLTRLPAEVTRLLVVGQADGVADLAAAGSITAEVLADGAPATTMQIAPVPAFPTVQVAEVYRHGAGWKVRCLGDGYADGLARLLTVHGIDVTDTGDGPPPAPPAAPPPAPADLEKRRQAVILEKVQAGGSPSLVKKVQAAAVSLDKRGLAGQRAQVVLVLDVSGSSRPLFKDGRYQVLVERALAAGLLFDDDGTIETWLFDHRLHRAPDITLANSGTWAHEVARMRGLWGATEYAPPIRAIAESVGRGRPVPTYVIFITDGGNSDRRNAAAALKTAAGASVFWQFMAVGREQDFPFLRKLDDLKGREVDNADFFAVENPEAVPDGEFFDAMMTEFPQWIADARRLGILQGPRPG